MGGGRVGAWEVGDGRATVTGKFDSIDSIVDPIRCRCLRLVGWACIEMRYVYSQQIVGSIQFLQIGFYRVVASQSNSPPFIPI